MHSIKYAKSVIVQAVAVHYLNLVGDNPILSSAPATLTKETVDYIRAHILKTLEASDVTPALPFNEIGPVHVAAKQILDSDFNEDDENELNSILVTASRDMTQFAFQMAKTYPQCPDFDMVVAKVVIDEVPAVAILCLDHLPALKHFITGSGGDLANSLKKDYVLPTVKQKASKVGIFFYSDFTEDQYLTAMVAERPFKDGAGDRVTFFTRQVLQCTEEWDDESLTALLLGKAEILTQISTRGNIRASIDIRRQLRSVFNEGGIITPKSILEIVYDDQEALDKATDNFEAAYGIDVDRRVTIDKAVVKKRIGKQQWKTSTGFTVIGDPAQYMDPNYFEVKHNEDGTVNFTIKNVRDFTAKA